MDRSGHRAAHDSADARRRRDRRRTACAGGPLGGAAFVVTALRPTVLAVDDEPSILQWLTRALAARDYRVLTADNVRAARDILTKDRVDAVILDARLVRDSGLQILEFVRSIRTLADLPVIVLTAALQLTEDEKDLIVQNRAYVFYKPQALAAIVATLDRLL